jgi:hypothetical protein
MRSARVSYAVLLAFVNLLLVPLEASAAVEPGGQTGSSSAAQNMQIVVNDGVVTLSYDLVGGASQTFEVALQISQDGGQTYALKPTSVTGDIGRGVIAGPSKKIVWEAGKDTDSLQLDRFRFHVVSTPETPAVVVGRRDGVQPRTDDVKPAVPPVMAHRNGMLWPSLAMIGGGLAIGGMAQSGPLKRVDPQVSECSTAGIYQSECLDYYQNVAPKKPNTPIVAVGGAVAIGGVVLLILGHHHSAVPDIVPLRGGFFVMKAVVF